MCDKLGNVAWICSHKSILICLPWIEKSQTIGFLLAGTESIYEFPCENGHRACTSHLVRSERDSRRGFTMQLFLPDSPVRCLLSCSKTCVREGEMPGWSSSRQSFKKTWEVVVMCSENEGPRSQGLQLAFRHRKRCSKQSTLWRLQKKLLNSLNREAIRLRCL